CGSGSDANPRLLPLARPAPASRKVILPGPNPTDRARPGSKHHIVTDANGTPLAAILTGANVNDVTQLLPLIDSIPPIRGLRGHPLHRPRVVYADRGYDSERHRQALRNRGIEPVIAKRRTEHGSGLGKYRWVVERTHAWLHHFRRLRIRFERRADIHGAFLKLGCCLICWNTLRRAEQSL
ncbi:IS5 family transposase, partial [Burkholderia pseudomallei]|uniref:IS5 family transposase n=5 Tax=Burkholderiaceae TaxID=119060 RepID=UPI002181EB16